MTASPPPRRIVLDDTDSSITYDGPDWTNETGTDVGTLGPPYLNTLHRTTLDGTISFAFNGTGIQIYGSNISAMTRSEPDPSYECFIDDTSLGKGTALDGSANNNLVVCEKENLSDGLHSVRIEVQVLSSGQTFWLDRIIYTPSASVPLDDKVLIFENTDPIIELDDKWTKLGDIANMTTQTNSTALVNFFGVSLSWVAFIPTELPHVQSSGTWSLDGAPPEEFFIKALGDQSQTVYNQFLFTTPDAQPGQHSLLVTFHGSPSSTPLGLDYLYIRNGTLSSNGRNGTTSNTISTGTLTAAPTATTTSSQAMPNGVDRHGKDGLIVGSIIGGLGFFLLIFAAFVFYKRRQIREYETSLERNPQPLQIRQTGDSQSHNFVKLETVKPGFAPVAVGPELKKSKKRLLG